MRIFAAIGLPESVRADLARSIEDFRASLVKFPGKDDAVRWVRPEGIHLTLKFLGEISEAKFRQAAAALRALGSFAPFEVEVRGFGFFPSSKRPRVFWAGIEAPPPLHELASRVDEAMAAIGYQREERTFSPHLTLARFKTTHPQPAFETVSMDHAFQSFGRFEVTRYFLFESRLAAGQPAVYIKLASFPDKAP